MNCQPVNETNVRRFLVNKVPWDTWLCGWTLRKAERGSFYSRAPRRESRGLTTYIKTAGPIPVSPASENTDVENHTTSQFLQW